VSNIAGHLVLLGSSHTALVPATKLIPPLDKSSLHDRVSADTASANHKSPWHSRPDPRPPLADYFPAGPSKDGTFYAAGTGGQVL
jgi:hypothetical protein